MEIWQNRPHCSVALSKSNVFLSIYCKLKTNFIAKNQLCALTREHKQKKNPIFIFQSVRVRLRESVRLRECANTEFDWEVKRGFEKASVSKAVRLRERPLAESWLYIPRAVCIWINTDVRGIYLTYFMILFMTYFFFK